MKKSLLFSFLIALLISSCNDDDTYTGEGPIVTEELNIADFSAIEAIGTMDVTISKGSEQKVEVTGHANIIDRLETKVTNGIWKMTLKEGNYKNADLSFDIIIPELNGASMEGSGDIEINQFSSAENVYFGIIGSGNIRAAGNDGCENLVLEIEGSGNATVTDDFIDLSSFGVAIVGSGAFDGFPMSADQVDVNIVGSADCSVTANVELNVRIDGSGTVRYKGSPMIDSDISGSGKIIDSN